MRLRGEDQFIKKITKLIMSEEENTYPESFTVQTEFGAVKLPVDENWQEYTKEERDRISELIVSLTDSKESVDELNQDEELTVRHLAGFNSLEEARKASDGYVLMVGDWGGQIYLTCPVKYLKCDEAVLDELLLKIDELEWGCNEGEGAEIRYGRAKPGDGACGGMGGGIAEDGLWVHPDLPPESVELIKKTLIGNF